MHNSALFLSQCSTLSLSFLFQLFGQVFTCWVGITEILMHCESLSPSLFFFSPSIFHADGDVTDGNRKFSPSSESSVETQRACGEGNISTYSSCIHTQAHKYFDYTPYFNLSNLAFFPSHRCCLLKEYSEYIHLIYAICLILVLFAFPDKYLTISVLLQQLQL